MQISFYFILFWKVRRGLCQFVDVSFRRWVTFGGPCEQLFGKHDMFFGVSGNLSSLLLTENLKSFCCRCDVILSSKLPDLFVRDVCFGSLDFQRNCTTLISCHGKSYNRCHGQEYPPPPIKQNAASVLIT